MDSKAILFHFSTLVSCTFIKEKKRLTCLHRRKSRLSFLILTCVLYYNRLTEFLFCTLCLFFTRNIVKNYWQVLLYHFNVKFLHIFQNKIFNFQNNNNNNNNNWRTKAKDQRSPARQFAANPFLHSTSPVPGASLSLSLCRDILVFFLGKYRRAQMIFSLVFLTAGSDRGEEGLSTIFTDPPAVPAESWGREGTGGRGERNK